MNKITLFCFGAAILSAPILTNAYAREHACTADIQKFCPTAENWKDKKACLDQHESDPNFSTACKDFRIKMKERFAKFKAKLQEACSSDIKSVSACSQFAGADSKPWELVKCLKANDSSPSDSCKKILDKKHGRHHHKQDADSEE